MESYAYGLIVAAAILFVMIVVICHRKIFGQPPVISHALDEEEMDFKLELERRDGNDELFEGEFESDVDGDTELDDAQIEQLKLLAARPEDDFPVLDPELEEELAEYQKRQKQQVKSIQQNSYINGERQALTKSDSKSPTEEMEELEENHNLNGAANSSSIEAELALKELLDTPTDGHHKINVKALPIRRNHRKNEEDDDEGQSEK